MRPRHRPAAVIFTAAALIFIGAETLFPHPERIALVAQTPIWCLVCGDMGVLDVLLNLILFMPLGAGLAFLGRDWRRAMLIGGTLSLLIELSQYFFIAGRDASLSDLITNTTGTALGALLATSWRAWLRPTPATARLLASATAMLWLTQVAVTGAAVRPSLPQTTYWGQRAADLAQFDTFPGRLLDARVGALSLPSHQLANSAEVRRLLLQGSRIEAVAVPAGPTRGLAPLASIFDQEEREIAVLGQWNRDLVFRLRTGAIELELRPPAVRLPGVFGAADRETLTVAGALHGGRFEIEARRAGSRITRELPLSAQWGWSLLLPFDYAFGTEVEWLSALWVAAWLIPIGFWLRATGADVVPATLATFGLLLAGVAGIPVFFHETGSFLQWVFGLAGAAAGWSMAAAICAPGPT